jgi:hypothetical protein
MPRITGLLIDPATETSTVLRFAPELAEFRRLLDTHLIAGFSDENHQLSYTYADEVADDETGIVHSRGWAYPMRGRLLITGQVDGQSEHTSLTPDQIETCRCIHLVGWLLPTGGAVLQPLRYPDH